LGIAGNLSKTFLARIEIVAGDLLWLSGFMKWVLMTMAMCVVAGCVAKTQIPVPDTAMAAGSGDSLETLQRGHAVYVTQCGRCHEPMMPSKVSDEDWHVVVPGMAWNAGISKSDEAAVLKYIHAAR
jgi:mono/diheme cytochrome c family protein